MPFVKGTSPNPAGRPKGKKPKPIKPMIEKLLEKSYPMIEQDLNSTPKIRQEFFKDLTRIILTNK